MKIVRTTSLIFLLVLFIALLSSYSSSEQKNMEQSDDIKTQFLTSIENRKSLEEFIAAHPEYEYSGYAKKLLADYDDLWNGKGVVGYNFYVVMTDDLPLPGAEQFGNLLVFGNNLLNESLKKSGFKNRVICPYDLNDAKSHNTDVAKWLSENDSKWLFTVYTHAAMGVNSAKQTTVLLLNTKYSAFYYENDRKVLFTCDGEELKNDVQFDEKTITKEIKKQLQKLLTEPIVKTFGKDKLYKCFVETPINKAMNK